MKDRTFEVNRGDYLEACWGGFTKSGVYLGDLTTLVRVKVVGMVQPINGPAFIGAEIETVVGENYPRDAYCLSGEYDDGGKVLMHELMYIKNLKVGLRLSRVPQDDALKIIKRVGVRRNGRVSF